MSSALSPMHNAAPTRRIALPAWLFSIAAHASLFAALGSLGKSVSQFKLDRPLTTQVRSESESEQPAERQVTAPITLDARGSVVANSNSIECQFLTRVEPIVVAESLPKLPEVDAATIGSSDPTTPAGSELLVGIDEWIAAAANVKFFGTQAWGSKFVYLIDRSGSMAQRDRIGVAKRELLASLSKLPPDTQFQIIFYNTDPSLILRTQDAKLYFATEHNKNAASHEIDTVTSEGGTEHLRALQLALTLEPDIVFLLTDADDLRTQDIAAVTEFNKDRAQIYTIEFGIGAAVDEPNQLRELANRNGGTYRYVDAANLDSLAK